MAELTRYVCPNCNGVLQFSSESSQVTCEFCGGTFVVEDLTVEVGNEAQIDLDAGEHATSAEDCFSRAPWAEAEGNLVSHTCNTCGAEIVCDQATVATNCPYCGNVMVASSILAGHQPDLVVPFKVERAMAQRIMGTYVTGKWYLPKGFSAELRHLQGVYVPYYLYSTEVDGWAHYDGKIDKTVGSKDNRHTITIHKHVYRAGEAEFVRIPVDGSSKMPDGHMDAIEPFDFGELKPFTVGYLAGYLAEVADETTDDCWQRAHDRCRNTFERRLESDACRNVDRVSRERYETNIRLTGVETTMIPVWLMHCTWGIEEMLFAVNGQTGRIVGNMPHDSGKRTLTIAACIVVALAISLTVMFMSDEALSERNIGILLILTVGLPFLVDAHFMGQVKTANEKHDANEAVERGHFAITDRRG